MPSKSRLAEALLLLVLILVTAGCASTSPYAYGRRENYFVSQQLPAVTQTQIVHGEPRPVLDTVGWIIGIPAKIILWDSRVDNHDVNLGTESAIAEYLAANELSDVKVRINQYDPVDEWHRLCANDSVGWGWRYTFGLVTLAEYAILPGRVFGGDNYNPYTNSINVYSDAPALALHEGGHAKDFARRKYKGTYAAVYAIVPGAPLWHEAVASRDALGWIEENGASEDLREAYTLLYPAYGTYVGGAIGDLTVIPAGLAYGTGVIGGHIVGRLKASRVRDDEQIAEHGTILKIGPRTSHEEMGPELLAPPPDDLEFPAPQPTP